MPGKASSRRAPRKGIRFAACWRNSGCKVEELQLGTIERIERALALYLIVAWRIAHLMRIGRTCPDLDASLFFDPDEFQAAYLLNKKLAPPASKLNDVLRMIARAGGFLARKGDGEPGATKTIWEGLRDVRLPLILSKRYAKSGFCRVVYNEVRYSWYDFRCPSGSRWATSSLRLIDMHYFYRRAFLAFVLLLIVDALIACFCIYQSYPTSSFMPREKSAVHWHFAAMTDGPDGVASTVRIHDTGQQSLSFDFKLSRTITYPWASVALLIDDADGKPAPEDMSKYSTVTFLAKCEPANSLIFNINTVDESVTKPGEKLTYVPAMTFFSCNEKGMPVSLDLTRLAIPEWWYEVAHVDIARRSYTLDRVVQLEFGASQYSPREPASHVEISHLTLHGRDYRYLVVLAAVLVIGWSGYGIWFFWAQSLALIAKLESRLKKDLSLVAYRQLTVESFEDEEKASILRFITTHYADPGLDLDGVAAGTGANRNKINDVLKTELGMTFTSYLTKLRLTEAIRLLTDKASATVAEIAYSVGYADSSYFNKLFKEAYGCSPKAFRSLASRLETPSGHHPVSRGSVTRRS